MTLNLAISLGAFEGGLDKAGRALDKRAKSWEKIGNQIGNALGIAIAGGLTAATVAIKSSINSMDDLSKAAQRVGLPTEELSKLNYAAGLADVSLENLTTGLGRLTKAQAAALNETSQQAKVFDALGISIEDASGRLRSSGDVLADFADRFKALNGSPEAIAAGMAIFGKSFQTLIPLLKDGGQGIRDAGAELENFRGVVTTEAGRNAEQFNDNLKGLKTAATGLATAVAIDLLPQLVDLTNNLVSISKDGERTTSIANDIGNAIKGVGVVVQFVGGYFTAFGNVIDGTTQGIIGLYEAASGLITLDWNRIKVGIGIAQQGADLAYYGKDQKFPTSKPKPNANRNPATNIVNGTGQFANVNQTRDQIRIKELQDALANNSATKSGSGGGKKASGGKSDAQREAEQLLSAYNSLVANLKEQTALTGDVSDLEKLRYDFANGELAKLDPAQKMILENLTLQKVAAEEANKVQEEGKRLTESLLSPFEEINKRRAEAKALLDAGAISQDTYNRALIDQLTPAEDMLANLRFEAELLGKTREEQELLTAARQLGAEAATAQGQAALAALKDFQEQSKANEEQIQLMDGVRDSFGSFFTSIIDGSKSAKDAFKDLVADILAQITKILVNKAIEQLFGAQGTTGQGTTGGGFFASLFGAVAGAYGGGKASGGSVLPGNFYRVNENGPEMLTSGGRDYLMMGSQAGRITPNRGALNASTGAVVNQQITVQGTVNRRTSEQLARASGRQAQRGIARTGR